MKTCKSDSKKCDEVKYPCLMKGPNSGIIVLMSKKGCGIVVHGSNSIGNVVVGDYCTDWGTLEPYNGSITLEND